MSACSTERFHKTLNSPSSQKPLTSFASGAFFTPSESFHPMRGMRLPESPLCFDKAGHLWSASFTDAGPMKRNAARSGLTFLRQSLKDLDGLGQADPPRKLTELFLSNIGPPEAAWAVFYEHVNCESRKDGRLHPDCLAPNDPPVRRCTPQAYSPPAQQQNADPGPVDRGAFPQQPGTPQSPL